jgi:hypothetical protein
MLVLLPSQHFDKAVFRQDAAKTMVWKQNIHLT